MIVLAATNRAEILDAALPRPGRFDRQVTVPLPAGETLGSTQQLPEHERHLYSEQYLFDTLAVQLGGRAAELIIFGCASTGAANDLAMATGLAPRWSRSTGYHLSWDQ